MPLFGSLVLIVECRDVTLMRWRPVSVLQYPPRPPAGQSFLIKGRNTVHHYAFDSLRERVGLAKCGAIGHGVGIENDQVGISARHHPTPAP